MDLFDKTRRDMEAEVKKSYKWVVLTALVGLVLMTLYLMVT
jgi:hypothetical protein